MIRISSPHPKKVIFIEEYAKHIGLLIRKEFNLATWDTLSQLFIRKKLHTGARKGFSFLRWNFFFQGNILFWMKHFFWGKHFTFQRKHFVFQEFFFAFYYFSKNIFFSDKLYPFWGNHFLLRESFCFSRWKFLFKYIFLFFRENISFSQ